MRASQITSIELALEHARSKCWIGVDKYTITSLVPNSRIQFILISGYCNDCGGHFENHGYYTKMLLGRCAQCNHTRFNTTLDSLRAGDHFPSYQSNLSIKDYDPTTWKVTIHCSECGNDNVCSLEHFLDPKRKRYKHGCKTCSNRANNSAKRHYSDEDELRELLLDKNIELVEYYPPDHHGDCLVKCAGCDHEWYSRPSKLLNSQSSCFKCCHNNFSKDQLRCMEGIEARTSLSFNFSAKTTEFSVRNGDSGKLWRVDGYDVNNDTVLEYNGDRYHGNPKVFAAEEACHPYDPNLTAGELLRYTLQKEAYLKSLGFKVISIWESDFYVDRSWEEFIAECVPSLADLNVQVSLGEAFVCVSDRCVDFTRISENLSKELTPSSPLAESVEISTWRYPSPSETFLKDNVSYIVNILESDPFLTVFEIDSDIYMSRTSSLQECVK